MALKGIYGVSLSGWFTKRTTTAKREALLVQKKTSLRTLEAQRVSDPPSDAGPLPGLVGVLVSVRAASGESGVHTPIISAVPNVHTHLLASDLRTGQKP